MRKIVIVVFTLLLLIPTKAIAVESGDVFIIGSISHNKYVLKDNKCFVPLSFFSESLGLKVNQSEKNIIIEEKGNILKVEVGESEYIFNDKKTNRHVKSYIEEGIVYVPLGLMCQLFGISCIWDPINRVAIVGEHKESGANLKDDVTYDFKNSKVTITIPNNIRQRIVIVKKHNVFLFFDRENYENPLALRTGYIFTLSEDTSPIAEIIPGIVLSYNDGIYVQVGFASDVAFSSELTQRSYGKTRRLLIDMLKSTRVIYKGENK